MTEPINSFYIHPNSLGGELDLYWNLPDELPGKYLVFIFKKAGAAITDVTGYFEIYGELQFLLNIEDPTPQDLLDIEEKTQELNNYIVTNNLFVKILGPGTEEFIDMLCDNETEYFYNVYILDLDTSEVSLAESDSETPALKTDFHVFDSKENVIKSLEWVINSFSTANESSMNLKVLKEFNAEENVDQWVVVRKASEEAAQKFIGDVLYEWNDTTITGRIEKEVIEVKWYCRDNPDRRDSLSRFFKGCAQVLKRYLLHAGAIDAIFSFMGDGTEPRDTSSVLHNSGMLITVISETSANVQLDAAPVFPDYIPTSPPHN